MIYSVIFFNGKGNIIKNLIREFNSINDCEDYIFEKESMFNFKGIYIKNIKF